MIPYKQLTKEQKEMIKITEEFWEYAVKSGCECKLEWERYRELIDICPGNACGFCEINKKCNICIFHVDNGRCKLYWKWKESSTKKERKEYAKEILSMIEQYRKGKI